MTFNARLCTRCVMDTSDPLIEFDDQGVCNHCRLYDAQMVKLPSGARREGELQKLVENIKARGRDAEHDCIIGVSGGVDSTYLAFVAVELGLRPLAVHVDGGWNSEIAVGNIERLTKTLRIELETFVVNWDEMRDLQTAFLRASVPNCDIPQDHAFVAAVYKVAARRGIRFMLSGHNIATELVLPRAWGFDSGDLRHLRDVHRRFGTGQLKQYPTLSPFDRYIRYKYLQPVRAVRLLQYIDYQKAEAQRVIADRVGWRDYGGKHYESRFTRFFQAYYLPKKFGIDKRRAHLSNLILSNQISRQRALDELRRPLYEPGRLEEDIAFVLKKLRLSREEFELIMETKPRSHSEFDTDERIAWFRFAKKIYLRRVRG